MAHVNIWVWIRQFDYIFLVTYIESLIYVYTL